MDTNSDPSHQLTGVRRDRKDAKKKNTVSEVSAYFHSNAEVKTYFLLPFRSEACQWVQSIQVEVTSENLP
jgi:hypothetical protein